MSLEGDRVLITAQSRSNRSKITKPLQKGGQTSFGPDVLEHDSIIGKSVRDHVRGSKGTDYRVTVPTLEEYVTMIPRKVTPIYSADANLIVSLLDIHVFPPNANGTNCAPVEILEAGTGHGALTLHLARAIHAANGSPPEPPSKPTAASGVTDLPDLTDAEVEFQSKKRENGPVQDQDRKGDEEYSTWLSQRGGIVHTVDISREYSKYAEKVVRGFRRGIYAGNVDFHVSHVQDWIFHEVHRRQGAGASQPNQIPFLSYAILDMPSSSQQLERLAPVMHTNGIIAVFMPNVTQIAECEEIVRARNIRLSLEKVVELGTGISSGRLWDVRVVKKRKADAVPLSTAQKLEDSVEVEKGSEDTQTSAMKGEAENAEDQSKETSSDTGRPVLVCRPKVYERIVGGGFLGLFVKMKDTPISMS